MILANARQCQLAA